MKEAKLYFKDEDSTKCYGLEAHLQEAKEEGLNEITLMEANPDKGESGYIWCKSYGDAIEQSDCSKSICPYYQSKSGRGKCSNKGKLFLHGEEVKFQIT